MTNYLLILVSTILVNNFALIQFLGLCSFTEFSNNSENSIGTALATTFVLNLSSFFSYLIYSFILQPFSLEYLRIITFILVIAVVVQFTEMIVRKTRPLLYHVLGIFLPLITTNCAVLSVALINAHKQNGFIKSILYGFSDAVVFSFVLILLSAMRERINVADVPNIFKDFAINMITAGLIILAFMGFTSLVQI